MERGRGGQVDRACGCGELIDDASLLDGQWGRAAGALEAFAGPVPHVPALMKLVEIYVDAESGPRLRSAQGQLADAYLSEGLGAEARIIAESLVDHDPSSGAQRQRLRRATERLGVRGVERVVRAAAVRPPRRRPGARSRGSGSAAAVSLRPVARARFGD